MSTIQHQKIRTDGNTIIVTTHPVIGILTLTGFVDMTSGENPPIYDFIKTFRYTKNGIDYSEWQSLIIDNIEALSFDASDLVIFEIAYERVQPLGDDELEFNSIVITATDATDVVVPYFQNSLFSKYFDYNDIELLSWTVNVLEKIYYKGLLPSYIQRKDSNGSNEDFIDLWLSIIRFFAFYVRYASVYEHFYQYPSLVSEFIAQRGIQPGNIEGELDNILETLLHQISKRGTLSIIDQDEDVTGELLRLIHFSKDEDEFLFNLYRYQDASWTLDRSSPLYRGLFNNINLNKMWAKDQSSVEDWYTTGTWGLFTQSGIGSVLNLTSGAGSIGSAIDVPKIIIDHRLDYEFSFFIKKVAGYNLSVRLNLFDKDDVAVLSIPHNIVDATGNDPLEDIDILRHDKYMLIRVVIYNSGKDKSLAAVTQTKQGYDIILPPTAAKIVPVIYATGPCFIYGIRLQPLFTLYSRGFIQVDNIISTWFSNRNNNYTHTQLIAYIRKYLIPYNAHIVNTAIGDYIYDDIHLPIANTYWEGAGAYCQRTIWLPSGTSCETTTLIWEPDEATAYCEVL